MSAARTKAERAVAGCALHRHGGTGHSENRVWQHIVCQASPSEAYLRLATVAHAKTRRLGPSHTAAERNVSMRRVYYGVGVNISNCRSRTEVDDAGLQIEHEHLVAHALRPYATRSARHDP